VTLILSRKYEKGNPHNQHHQIRNASNRAEEDVKKERIELGRHYDKEIK
jgi:hypothetical protein